MAKYWQEDMETMSPEDMKKLQSERLVKQVQHVYENVPYYRDLMDKKGVKPEMYALSALIFISVILLLFFSDRIPKWRMPQEEQTP